MLEFMSYSLYIHYSIVFIVMLLFFCFFEQPLAQEFPSGLIKFDLYLILSYFIGLFVFKQINENEEMRLALAELILNNIDGDAISGGGALRGNSIGTSDGDGDGGGDGGGDGAGFLDRDRDGEVWCEQDGRLYDHGEAWELDSCTSCSCQVSLARGQNLNQKQLYCERCFHRQGMCFCGLVHNIALALNRK